MLGLQEYNNIMAELKLLRTLAEAENDVIHGRVAPVEDTFSDIRNALLAR